VAISPNDYAALKFFLSDAKKIIRNWKMSARERKSTMNQFAILFADQMLPQCINKSLHPNFG
jgi:transposase-like protein